MAGRLIGGLLAISLAVIIILGLGADYLCRRFTLPGRLGMLLWASW